MNTYIDAIAYTKAATGLSLPGYYGDLGRIAASSAGATSFTLTSALTGVALSQYDDLYIFDGAKSEKLQVGSGGAAIGSLSVPLQNAAQYAHSGGTVYCTDGDQGSLGQAIFEASDWVDQICNQSLWSTVYTGEILTMPTMRAAIDNQQNLHFRPRHFPITALTSVTFQTSTSTGVTLDPAQAIIDADQQTVDIPNIIALGSVGSGSSQPLWVQPMSRQANAWLTIGYTAGYAAGSLPGVVSRACTLLINAAFALAENPIGAESITQGKRAVVFHSGRGSDQSGKSLLVKDAENMLKSFMMQAF